MLPSESERNSQFEVNTQASRPHYKPRTVRAPKSHEKQQQHLRTLQILTGRNRTQRCGSPAGGIQTGEDRSVPSNKVLRSPWAHPRVLRSPQRDRLTYVALGVRQPVARTSRSVHLPSPVFSQVTPPRMEIWSSPSQHRATEVSCPKTIIHINKVKQIIHKLKIYRSHVMPIFFFNFYLRLQCGTWQKELSQKSIQIIKLQKESRRSLWFFPSSVATQRTAANIRGAKIIFPIDCNTKINPCKTANRTPNWNMLYNNNQW